MADNLRVIEDIHRNRISTLIICRSNLKSPHESSHGQPGPLLGERLPRAHSPPPSKRHVSSLAGKWSRIWMIFQEAIRVKAVWVWELALVVMNCPYISLHPRHLWN